MEVREAIFKRRSVRKFQDKEVPNEIINSLLEDAMAAPSACNKKPWEFYVVKNKELQDSLKKKIMYCNYNSPLIIVVCGNKNNALTEEDNDFWIQDASAAIQNILLSCLSFGLGSCWCGLHPIKRRSDRVKNILNLKDNIIPLGLLHIGYPLEEVSGRTQYEENKVHYID